MALFTISKSLHIFYSFLQALSDVIGIQQFEGQNFADLAFSFFWNVTSGHFVECSRS